MEDKNFNSNADSDGSFNNSSSDSSNNKGSKMKTVIALVIVLIIGGGAVWAVSYINELRNELGNTGIKEDPNLLMNDEQVQEYLQDKVSAINVTMTTRVTCVKDDNGNIFANVNLQNLNDFQYVVKFDLMETGETIAQTGLVPAGQNLRRVALTKNLPKGKYSVNAIFTAISEKDNQTSMGATGINVDFIVSE